MFLLSSIFSSSCGPGNGPPWDRGGGLPPLLFSHPCVPLAPPLHRAIGFHFRAPRWQGQVGRPLGKTRCFVTTHLLPEGGRAQSLSPLRCNGSSVAVFIYPQCTNSSMELGTWKQSRRKERVKVTAAHPHASYMPSTYPSVALHPVICLYSLMASKLQHQAFPINSSGPSEALPCCQS